MYVSLGLGQIAAPVLYANVYSIVLVRVACCAADGTNKDDKPGLIVIQEIKTIKISSDAASRFELVTETNGASEVYHLQCLEIPGIVSESIPDPAEAVRQWVQRIERTANKGVYEAVDVVDEGETILQSGFLLKKGGGTSGWLAGTAYSERWFEIRGRKFRHQALKGGEQTKGADYYALPDGDAPSSVDAAAEFILRASTLRYYKYEKDHNGTFYAVLPSAASKPWP